MCFTQGDQKQIQAMHASDYTITARVSHTAYKIGEHDLLLAGLPVAFVTADWRNRGRGLAALQ